MGGSRAALVVAALALGAACGSDGGKKGAGSGDEDGGVVQDGSDGNDGNVKDFGTVQGRVVFADGASVGQVDVVVGEKKVRTDSRGVFVAEDVPKGPQKVAVVSDTVSAAQLEVAVDKGKASQVDLAVLALATVEVADSTKAGSVSGTDGVVVALEEKTFKTKKGADSQGAATAKYGLVKTGLDVKAAPGGMLAMLGEVPTQLESFGMIDLRFYEANEELDLVKPAIIDLPLGPNTFVTGDQVDVFSFDENTSLWKAEGKATIDKTAGNGIAKVTATHLSWWTVATPLPATSCLTGKLLTSDAMPKPIAGMSVTSVGENYWGVSTAVTDAEGAFCVNVKEAALSTVSAFGSNGAAFFDWKQTGVAATGVAACGGEGTCTDVGVLSGTSLFDECQGDVTSDQNHVLVLSSGLAELDAAVKTALEGFGHTVTVGVQFLMFDGTLDLSAYDAIYLQANNNWSTGDMPVAGQRQLINWVNCGGGLVTSEWTTWKIGSNGFQLIDAIFPAARTTAYASNTTETFIQVTAEPTLNAGLPESFTFTLTSFAGTQSNLNPRPGATIYYDSMSLDSGLLGWPYNLGRVASFSTTVGASEVADPNLSRLLANALDWVQRD